ncbi:MAG: hypothetical protein LBL90_03640 [Prevotellaceae bacterium]|nr:hypothetical protein [Prevotellaceae bacterium]
MKETCFRYEFTRESGICIKVRIDLTGEEGKLDGVLSMVEVLKAVSAKDTNNVMITSFWCYRQGLPQGERLVQLNSLAITQMRSLVDNRNLKQLK